jgi:hypothetical protein
VTTGITREIKDYDLAFFHSKYTQDSLPYGIEIPRDVLYTQSRQFPGDRPQNDPIFEIVCGTSNSRHEVIWSIERDFDRHGL